MFFIEIILILVYLIINFNKISNYQALFKNK